MARYAKGANAERELIHILWEKGFAVGRVAGSGKNLLPMPDIIAINKDKKLIFECKAWSSGSLAIPIEKMEELLIWGNRANAEAFIAWKQPFKGWFFISPQRMNKTVKNYTISQAEALNRGLELNIILGLQRKLSLKYSKPHK